MKCFALVALGTFLLSGCQAESASAPAVEATDVGASGVEASDAGATAIAAEVTPVAFNIVGAPTVELEVPDMMCQFSCAAKVKEVLTAQTGVKDVKIDFDAKKAIVAVDEAEFDGEAAVAALVDYQFSNTKLIVVE